MIIIIISYYVYLLSQYKSSANTDNDRFKRTPGKHNKKTEK